MATNYELPVVKPKRQSYEWYQPKGILKRNWILKHLHVLPAVVVLFQDIEWNDPEWTEKQYQCASMVQTIKNSIQVRTKLLFSDQSLEICNNFFLIIGQTHKIGNCSFTKTHKYGRNIARAFNNVVDEM